MSGRRLGCARRARRGLVAAAALLLFPASAAHAAPPPNDSIANAIAIESLPFTHAVDLTEATSEPGEPRLCDASVHALGTAWYRFTPLDDTAVRFTSADSWGAITIFAGDPGALSQFVGCDRTFKPVAGTTYYIQFRGTGAHALSATPGPRPANDEIEAAVPFMSLPFSHSDIVWDATNAPDDPPDDCDRSKSTWYRMTLPSWRRVQLSAGLGGFPHWYEVSVYTGARGSLAQITCAYSSVSFDAAPNTPYWIRVTSREDSNWTLDFAATRAKFEAPLDLQVSPTKLTYGVNVTARVHLGRVDLSDVSNRQVELWAEGEGMRQRLLATGTLDDAGDWTTTVKPARHMQLRARWRGDDWHADVTSARRAVGVYANLTARLLGGRPGPGGVRLYRAGAVPRLVVRLAPSRGVKIRLYLDHRPKNTWRRIAQADFRVDSQGRVGVYVTVPSGRYRIRAEFTRRQHLEGKRTPWLVFQIGR